jgi:uncharacterized membrane protein YfcA
MITSSAFVPAFLWLPLIGCAVGLLVTLFGGGGGFFYVPLLTLLLHVPTQIAAATSLAVTIPTVIVGSIEHYRKGNIDLKVGIVLGAAGIVGAFGGAYVSNLLSSVLLRKLFGGYCLALAVPMVLTSKNRLKGQDGDGTASRPFTISRFVFSLFFGLLSGVMAGLFGTSGTASIVAGLYILRLPVTLIIGTSVFVVLFNALSGFAGHVMVGHFDLTLLLLLGSGSVVGGFIGPRILAKLDVRRLERVYGVLFILLVVGFGLAMILK